MGADQNVAIFFLIFQRNWFLPFNLDLVVIMTVYVVVLAKFAEIECPNR